MARHQSGASKSRKVLCGCCGDWLPERTERRHRALATRPHIKAKAAYEKSFLWYSRGSQRQGRSVQSAWRQGPGPSSTPDASQNHDDMPSPRQMPDDFTSPGSPSVSTDVDEDACNAAGGVPDVDLTQVEQAAQRNVWTHSRYSVTMEEVEDDDDSMSTEQGISSGLEDEPDIEDVDDDELDAPDEFDPELSAWDQLNHRFLEEAAKLGAEKLTPSDKAILRAFAFYTDSRLGKRNFAKIPYAFPTENLPSAEEMLSRVAFLSGIKPMAYDCCAESCCCFTGPHASLTACPYCHSPRYDSDGQPRKKFTYLPLIPRLVALYSNKGTAEKMMYRAYEHKTEPGMIRDVFDAWVYRRLLGTRVKVDGKEIPYTFFADPRDIALGLSTDGFAPWRRRKLTAWPIILFNYNLPPEIRFHIENILVLGIIPGPKKPIDYDSFLWPAMEELLRLEVGVRAYDASSGDTFALRAYLILAFGDIPAMSLLLRMKGHNALSPCRMCKIRGLRVPGSRATTHYVPLDRSCHPAIQHSNTAIHKYNPHTLPMREHDEMLAQAREVQFARSNIESEALAKEYGIKGVPVISYLSSLSFPHSFPYDFMHLIWENLIPNLILLWTGDFKGLDEARGSYEFNASVWDAIGEVTSRSSSTIPHTFGPSLGNPAVDKSPFTAEAWSLWTLYVAPVLLRRKFREQKYYTHFIELVKILRLCLQFEYTSEDIKTIRQGFIRWVEKYEEMYYQYSPERLPTCTVTVHALLHIADSIELAGPVWASWAFPMERYCGRLQPAIKSRRFPWASIDRFVVNTARLTQIKLVYNMSTELSLKPQGIATGHFSDPLYPTCTLLYPRTQKRLDSGLYDKIIGALATRFGKSSAVLRSLVPAEIERWGKVKRLDGGDTMHASSLVKRTADSRDMSFVRYEVLVDKYARQRRRQPVFELQTFFGELQHIFVIRLARSEPLGLEAPTTIILAAIKTCVVEESNLDLDIYYYSRFGRLNIVDITCIQCVVGRVPEGNRWAIVDRSGTLARAIYVGDE